MSAGMSFVDEASPRGEKRITLDSRLSLIAEMVGRCACYADIGCDHGRLGAYLLQNDRCERAQLTDISEPSLRKARALIGMLEMSDRAVFCVGDGANALAEPADVAVIAGMGGATIAHIIKSGRERLGSARLILQPNVGARELREALVDCGYRISDERVVQDGGRNYLVIAAEPGTADYSERELVVGPVLLARLPEEMKPYAVFRLRVARKALRGASAAGDAESIKALSREVGIWEEVCACLQR